jgi:hypothetical protein
LNLPVFITDNEEWVFVSFACTSSTFLTWDCLLLGYRMPIIMDGRVLTTVVTSWHLHRMVQLSMLSSMPPVLGMTHT